MSSSITLVNSALVGNTSSQSLPSVNDQQNSVDQQLAQASLDGVYGPPYILDVNLAYTVGSTPLSISPPAALPIDSDTTPTPTQAQPNTTPQPTQNAQQPASQTPLAQATQQYAALGGNNTGQNTQSAALLPPIGNAANTNQPATTPTPQITLPASPATGSTLPSPAAPAATLGASDAHTVNVTA